MTTKPLLKKPSPKDIFNHITTLLRTGTDVLPPENEEWYSVYEWAELWGKSVPRANNLCAEAFRKGLMDRFSGRLNGRAVYYYKFRIVTR